ncbi:MAG TPA: DddA-like double-stranded DNA deaminase toxin [Pseudonocardiaceae bacterium]|nr:DddA-like double-stranded DNA deaminase toxin [Pseudonocardiaceae bacterium]
MLQRLFGRLVLVVVVVLGLWFVISHYHGNDQFGCQVDFPAAQAEVADGVCPANLAEAATDAQWAAARIASIADAPITTGLLYDEDGHEERIESGQSGPAFEHAVQYLRPYAGIQIFDRPPGQQAAGHVEVKASALMRDAGLASGVLVINNPAGPCGYVSNVGCPFIMELILPKGSSIVVWWPGGKHGMYEGTAER